MQQLIQGAFQCEWIREAQQKDREQRNLRMKRMASSTKASEGHARGAEHFAEVRVRLSVQSTLCGTDVGCIECRTKTCAVQDEEVQKRSV